MTQANDRQVGGDHYKKEYQHWDFVTDTGLPYLLGCFTKYVTRWRGKNGLEDLNKSLHYLEKADERMLEGGDQEHRHLAVKFAGQHDEREARAILAAYDGRFDEAAGYVQDLMAAVPTG